MRVLLAALIALPQPLLAQVVTGSFAAEAHAPVPVLTAATPLGAATLAPAMPLTTLSLTPTPIATPAVAEPVKAVSALTNLGTVLAAPLKAETPGKALAKTFDGSLSAASTPDPVQEPESAKTPAPLKPATSHPHLRAAVPNGLTFSNMASGLTAALLASDGHFMLAGMFILLANLFDALDGRAARALKVDNPLGTDLDSLADVVSFGAAPAILIFKAALLPAFGWWGFPVAAAFAAGGLYRLARFNVGAHAEKDGKVPPKKSDSFTGLPIPGGAGVIVALTMALSSIPAAAVAPVAAAVTLLAAAAMVSRLPYPAFKKGGAKALVAPVALGLAAAVPLALLGLPAMIPAAVFGLYLASGPAIALLKK